METENKINLIAKTTYVGTFLAKDVLHLTDPCFDVDVMGIVVENVKSGPWIAFVAETSDIPGWGERYSELCAYANPLDIPLAYDSVWSKIDGDIGVDSAQAGIGVFGEDGMPCENRPSIAKNGVACTAGFGDGSYDAFKIEHNGKVVALKIVFITPESLAEALEED